MISFIQKAMNKIMSRRFSKPTMRVVLFYLFFVILLLLSWYVGWLYIFASKGTPDLDSLSKFIVIVLGATGFFGFIIECFVDKNHNGIPDVYEKPPPPKRDMNESNRYK
jgi:hypothetical protein|nr:MAG TPA: corticosteroid 11-beta-dehydrogenase isozyme 1 [Caudoviricetes sp.]